MKKILILLAGVLSCSISFADVNPEVFYKAYREYKDRGNTLLPLSNSKLPITKITDSGKDANGNSIYRVYLNINLAREKYTDAVQVAVDKNGAIDSFLGIFSVSSTMIRNFDGSDARFPMGISEVQMSQLSQTAFEVAREQYVKTYGADFVGSFYSQEGSWNEKDKTINIEFNSYALPGHSSKSRMSAVYVTMGIASGKVVKFFNRDY